VTKQNRQHRNKKPQSKISDELGSDEIAFRLNPKDPSKVESYILGSKNKGKIYAGTDRIPSIIHPNLIVTSSSLEGFRSTMASRLGEMFLIAENLFGKRDRSYSFLGFEFTDNGPNLHYERDKSFLMRIQSGVMLEPMFVYAQMAHECVHMLSPCPQRPVTILEEGMAEFFAYIYMRDTMEYKLTPKPPGTAYHEAGQLVAMLMSLNPYGIKQIREEEPTISLITKSLIWKHYPMLEEGVVARLARTFVSDDCQDPNILAWYEKETLMGKATSDVTDDCVEN